jgi:predicted ArsR family transcriptional regulator
VTTWTERLAAVSALAEPVRRALYDLVSRRPDAVSRDVAAHELGLARSTAAFHLDKLAAAGLLDVDFQRLTGRTGPGAGRPAKLYRRADTEVGVSVPDRRYDLAGELLASAVEESATTGQPAREVLMRLARAAGHAIAAGSESLESVLVDNGFEPQVSGDSVELANCPFHRLAQRHRDIVCGLNLELLRGAAEQVGDPSDVLLDPAPGRCCVRVEAH